MGVPKSRTQLSDWTTTGGTRQYRGISVAQSRMEAASRQLYPLSGTCSLAPAFLNGSPWRALPLHVHGRRLPPQDTPVYKSLLQAPSKDKTDNHALTLTPGERVQFSRSVMSDSFQPHGRTPGLPVHQQLLEILALIPTLIQSALASGADKTRDLKEEEPGDETGWNLGTSPELQCLHLDSPLLQQQQKYKETIWD